MSGIRRSPDYTILNLLSLMVQMQEEAALHEQYTQVI